MADISIAKAGGTRRGVQLFQVSWFNMYGKQFDAIPRLKGELLWSQFVAVKRAGATMIYVAIFDEVDECTAISKCANDVTAGDGVKFLTYERLPSGFYLRLVGQRCQNVTRGAASNGECSADSFSGARWKAVVGLAA